MTLAYTSAVSGSNEPKWPTKDGDTVTASRLCNNGSYKWQENHDYLKNAIIAIVFGDNEYGAIALVDGTSSDHSAKPDWSTLIAAIDAGNDPVATVMDNDITWQSIPREDMVWKAHALIQTSGEEPSWPKFEGGSVIDGSAEFRASDFTIPQARDTGILAVQSHKIFADDHFSATDNPTDWESEGDAGFLPMADNFTGASEVTALAEYRGGLVAFSRDGYELWKTDPDPANMALINVGTVGTQYPYAIVQSGNDLYFISAAGIRSFALQSVTDNLADSDVGSPVDDLIVQALNNVSNGADIQAFYDGVTGACVWAINDQSSPTPHTRLFTLFLAPVKKIKAWAVHDLPYRVDYLCSMDGLYLMYGQNIYAATPLDSPGAHEAADEVES